MKQILDKIKLYKKEIQKVILFLTLTTLIDLIIIYIITLFIDMIMKQSNQLGYYLILMGVFIITSTCLGFAASKIISYIVTQFTSDLRYELYERVQNMSLQSINIITKESLLTRMTADMTNLQNSIQTVLTNVVRGVVTILSIIIIMCFKDFVLVVLFIIAMISILTISIYIGKKALPLFSKGLFIYDEMNQMVKDNIFNANIIKSFVKEEREIYGFNEQSQKMFKVFVKAENVTVLSEPYMTFIIDLCMIIILFISGQKVVNHTASIGDFLFMFTYATTFFMAFLQLINVLFSIILTIPSLQRIIEILTYEKDEQETIKDCQNFLINFENVSFSLQGHQILSNIQLLIPQGATIGIIGPTGSGKTTFAKLLSRIYIPDSGVIKMNYIDLQSYEKEYLMNQISYVQQNNVLFSGTIEELLKWGSPKSDDDCMLWASKIAEADEFIKQKSNGYKTYIEQGGKNFSGGQRQRLCIARALMKYPKVLILDEAMCSIDEIIANKILNNIQNQLKDTTKIYITQKVNQVMNCDQIFVFSHGKIYAKGKHADLLKTCDIYQALWSTQQIRGDFDAN